MFWGHTEGTHDDDASLTSQGSNVPCNVVAPPDGLHPVHGARVEPYQVTRPLDETVYRHVGLIQVLQVGPPRAHEEIYIIPVVEGGRKQT